MIDLITTGRPDLTEYAERHGYLRGARLDKLGEYEARGISVDFLDMHWKDPKPDLLLEKAAEHEPKYVVAGDYLRDRDNYVEVNERADELQNYAENVIVVPKSPGDLAFVPENAVIGYSYPTDYGGTDIPVWDYRSMDQDIHVLGGTPHGQLEALRHLGEDLVISMDTNSHHKAATIGAKAWYPDRPHWRKMEGENAVEDAYRASVQNLEQRFRAVAGMGDEQEGGPD